MPSMGWKFCIEVLVITILILSVGFLYLFQSSWLPKHHVGEPPLVPQRIPYIGHFASLFLQGMEYFDTLRYIKAGASRRFADKPGCIVPVARPPFTP